jgi:hypothetical protein
MFSRHSPFFVCHYYYAIFICATLPLRRRRCRRRHAAAAYRCHFSDAAALFSRFAFAACRRRRHCCRSRLFVSRCAIFSPAFMPTFSIYA